jgi:type I restriction enzyme, S subunit
MCARWIPNDWELSNIGTCLSGIDAGKSPDCPDTPATGDQWGVLKVGAIDPNEFHEDQNKVVLDLRLREHAFLVCKDDLLFSRANTSELVGLSCHVMTEPRNLMLSDKTLRLRPNISKMTTRFMFWTLQSNLVRTQIENVATGTSGSMKNIGQRTLRNLRCVRPELDEQMRITDRIDALGRPIASATAHLAKLRQLKQGLMQDLLRGRVVVSA